MQAFVLIDIDEKVLFFFAEDKHFVSEVEHFPSKFVIVWDLDLDRVSQQVDRSHLLCILL